MWLTNNAGTIIVAIVILLVVLLAIRSIINDKRNGRNSCGVGCKSCTISELCHHKKI